MHHPGYRRSARAVGEKSIVLRTNLSREVTIKVLAQFRKDFQRLALFDEAIRALASYISKAYTLKETRSSNPRQLREEHWL